MTTCDKALLINWKTTVSNLDKQMEYLVQKNVYKVNWLKAAAQAPSLINSNNSTIANSFSDGNYVKTAYANPMSKTPLIQQLVGNVDANAWFTDVIQQSMGTTDLNMWYNSHISDPNGKLQSCPGGDFGGCCYSVSNHDTMCCACNKNHSCNSGGGCLSTCNWNTGNPGTGCDNKLQTNIFNNTILSLQSISTSNINRNVSDLYNIYTSYTEPFIQQPSKLGCCQEYIMENISAADIIVDSQQNCTIVNGASSIPTNNS